MPESEVKKGSSNFFQVDEQDQLLTEYAFIFILFFILILFVIFLQLFIIITISRQCFLQLFQLLKRILKNKT